MQVGTIRQKLMPRAFEHWECRLGLGPRVEIQAAQYSKYPLLAVRYTLGIACEPLAQRIITLLMRLEARIQFLQTFSEEECARLRLLEEVVGRGERLAAVGELQRSIAHEHKNQLVILAAALERLSALFAQRQAWIELFTAFSACEMAVKSDEWEKVASLSAEIISALQDVQNTLAAMEETTRGILAFSGTGSDDAENIGVMPTLTALLRALTLRARSLNVDFSVDWGETHENAGVHIAPNALQAIIRNLVSNAIESFVGRRNEGYPRQVTLQVRVRVEEQQVRFLIKDNGSGIPPERLAALLTAPVRSSKPTGTGLGLALVSRLVRSASGDIRIESTVGEGTSVLVSLPYVRYEPATPMVEEETTPASLSREIAATLTVWVVEDDADLQRILEGRLKRMGFQVLVFGDPRQALTQYHGADRKPHIVLTDETMPGMLGHKLIQDIADASGGRPPVFAIYSGDHGLGDPQTAARGVIERYAVSLLPKGGSLEPLDREIIALARRALGEEGSSATSLVGSLQKPSSPLAEIIVTVVHKMNNLVVVVSGRIELAQGSLTSASATLGQERVQAIQLAAQRLDAFFDAIDGFCRQAGHLEEVMTLEELRLPPNLMDGGQFGKQWERIFPRDRDKIAVLLTLFMRAGRPLTSSILRYAEQASIDRGTLVQMLALCSRLSAAGNRMKRLFSPPEELQAFVYLNNR